jgi:hypothetical protein
MLRFGDPVQPGGSRDHDDDTTSVGEQYFDDDGRSDPDLD